MTIAVVPAGLADNHGKAGERSVNAAVEPQLAVVCTGWHALCTGSTDCQTNGGDKADCACWRVNEAHVVVTSEIQDAATKRLTQARCTSGNYCDVDEAPVCSAISGGEYEVDQVKYDWVSTYSYRGWCGLYRPKGCDTTQADYVGDMRWTICDAASCTEIQIPADPERPLSCQCRVPEPGHRRMHVLHAEGEVRRRPVEEQGRRQHPVAARLRSVDMYRGALNGGVADREIGDEFRD